MLEPFAKERGEKKKPGEDEPLEDFA